MSWLSFGDKRQERQWEVKFAADQAGLDAAVSLQTLLFPSLVARTVRARGEKAQSRLRPTRWALEGPEGARRALMQMVKAAMAAWAGPPP